MSTQSSSPSFFTELGRVFFNSQDIWNAPFNIEAESPYNLDNYPGRAGHFYSILDPRTLLVSSAEIHHCVDILKNYKIYQKRSKSNQSNKSLSIQGPNNINININLSKQPTNSDLWNAKRIVSSAIHPDTGNIIPWYFRFSAFSVLNIPMCVLLIWPGSNTLQIFAQCTNQSYNVAVNYHNRNASNPMSNITLASSYIAAVTVSCTVALGLRKYAAKTLSNQNSVFSRGFIPFLAIVLASSFNVYFIRWNEITDGIKLKYKKKKQNINNLRNLTFSSTDIGKYNKYRKNNQTEVINEESVDKIKNINKGVDKLKKDINNGNIIIGDEWIETSIKSKRAGHLALLECCAGRWITPPVLMQLFTKRKWWKKTPLWRRIGIECVVVGIALLTAVPASIAVFPQQDKISIDWLEPEFNKYLNDMDPDQNGYFYFNKGL